MVDKWTPEAIGQWLEDDGYAHAKKFVDAGFNGKAIIALQTNNYTNAELMSKIPGFTAIDSKVFIVDVHPNLVCEVELGKREITYFLIFVVEKSNSDTTSATN
jgi:hypothetical protein